MNKTQDIRNRARLSVRFFEREDISPEKTFAAPSSNNTKTTSILSRTQRSSPASREYSNGLKSDKPQLSFDFKRDTAVVAYKALAEAGNKVGSSKNGLPPISTVRSGQEERMNHSKLDHYIDEYDVKCIEVQSPKYVLKSMPFAGGRDSNRSSAESSTGSDLIARIEARYASKLKALHKEPAPPKMESNQVRLENLAKDLEAIMASDATAKRETVTVNGQKRSVSPTTTTPMTTQPTASTKTENGIKAIDLEETKIVSDSKCDDSNTKGHYVNWSPQHTALTTLPWCCIGDLMNFCDRYEYKTLNRRDIYTHNHIVVEVKALLNSPAPFDLRKRFPDDAHSPENLWVCIGRCAGVEYHLNRILNLFRRPLEKLSADKQRMMRHDFHLSLNELRLDISARITEVRLYDRNVFEKEFNLEWRDGE